MRNMIFQTIFLAALIHLGWRICGDVWARVLNARDRRYKKKMRLACVVAHERARA